MNWFISISLAFTAIHLVEEIAGPGGPIWTNFGKIVGTKLPDGVGFCFFTALLGLLLGAISYGAWVRESSACFGLLLGLRLSDSAISHWWLCLVGHSRPNPGICSTALYVAESVAILSVADIGWFYVAPGALFFAGVLPALDLVGNLVPQWRIKADN